MWLSYAELEKDMVNFLFMYHMMVIRNSFDNVLIIDSSDLPICSISLSLQAL
jgi:hypothetical protein